MPRSGDVVITIMINDTGLVGGKTLALNYAIGRDQAMELVVGPRPPEFDGWSARDWSMRLQRAERLANFIGSEVSYKLLQTLNELPKRND